MLNAKKKTTTLAVAILLLVLLTVGGVIAYMVATSSLTNTFTVGTFNEIDPDQPGPDSKDIDDNGSNLTEYLYECVIYQSAQSRHIVCYSIRY